MGVGGAGGGGFAGIHVEGANLVLLSSTVVTVGTVDVPGGCPQYGLSTAAAGTGNGKPVIIYDTGVLNFQTHITGPEMGRATVTWTGTLNVDGLTFDTTPPQIVDAKSKTAKTRKAAGTRVSYSVSAVDATDGKVPVTCRPKSGKIFRVGRTTVTCTALDSSGNTATKRFVITVKRVHR